MNFHSKTLIYITGPIGVGKTTLLLNLLNKSVPPIELVSTDLYYYLYFNNNHSSSISSNYEMAKKYSSYKLAKKIAEGSPFIWETVFAKQDKFNVLSTCIGCGYTVLGIFVGINSYEELLTRVLRRKDDGWYDVPMPKIVDRYHTTMGNLKKLFDISSSFIAIDSSHLSNRVVLLKRNNRVEFFSDTCKWISILNP